MRYGAIAFVLLLLAGNALAQEYYADVILDVDRAGIVSVTGRANHELLSSGTTADLTSKKGSYWLLNLTLPEEDRFSDYVCEIRLPEGASVNYVKASGTFRITNVGGRISVIASGVNESLGIIVQYQLPAPQGSYPPEMILGIIILSLILISATAILLRKKKVRHVGPPAAKEETEEPLIDGPDLTERQKDILRIIRESGQAVNQSTICERLDLPKSSVSRNIDSLERKGLVTKMRNGMSTMISLREKD